MWSKIYFRIGNIIHRRCTMWDWYYAKVFFFFYNCHFSTVYNMSLLVWPVLGFRFLVYALPPGSIYSEPLTGAPDNVNPYEPGTRPKWKMSFYACYHANGGGPIFVTVSCLRLFVFTIVSFHMSYVTFVVYSFVNCQQSVCLIAIKLKSSLNWDFSYVNCN